LIYSYPVGVYASGDENIGLDNPTFQMGPQPTPPLSPKDRKLRAAKLKRFNKWLATQPKINPKTYDRPLTNNDSLKVSPTYLRIIEKGVLSVIARKQEKWYYCGPATAQMILSYDWGMGERDRYSQKYLADYMYTSPSDGTYVYRLRNALNELKDPYKNPTAYWVYEYLPSDETDAANTLYSHLKYDITNGPVKQALAFHTNTWPKRGRDVWGKAYGLIGYRSSDGTSGHSTGHYVTGYGYCQYSTGRHTVWYIDSNDSNYGYGNCFGYHEVDTRNMATCVNGNAHYIIW